MPFDRLRETGDTESKDFRFKATDQIDSISRNLSVSFRTQNSLNTSFSLSLLGRNSISMNLSVSFRTQNSLNTSFSLSLLGVNSIISRNLSISSQTQNSLNISFPLSLLGVNYINSSLAISSCSETIISVILGLSYKSLELGSTILFQNINVSLYAQENISNIINYSFLSVDFSNNIINLSFFPCILINQILSFSSNSGSRIISIISFNYISTLLINSFVNMSFAGKNSYYKSVSIVFKGIVEGKGKITQHHKIGFIDDKKKIAQIVKRLTPFK